MKRSLAIALLLVGLSSPALAQVSIPIAQALFVGPGAAVNFGGIQVRGFDSLAILASGVPATTGGVQITIGVRFSAGGGVRAFAGQCFIDTFIPKPSLALGFVRSCENGGGVPVDVFLVTGETAEVEVRNTGADAAVVSVVAFGRP